MQHDLTEESKVGWGGMGMAGMRVWRGIRRCQSCKIYKGPQLLGLTSRRGVRDGVELGRMDIGEVVVVLGVGGLLGIRTEGRKGGAGGCGSADSRWCHSVYLIRAIDGP